MTPTDFIDSMCDFRGWTPEQANRIVELVDGHEILLGEIYTECHSFNEAIDWFDSPPRGSNGTRGYSEASGLWN